MLGYLQDRPGEEHSPTAIGKKLAEALRPIYTAATADAAETALLELADSDLGQLNKAAGGPLSWGSPPCRSDAR